jgi:undecaprenyl-diphosphatase
MTFFDSILLGILQGATEFLPVSSSGHLVLAQHLLPGFHQPGVLFEVLLHVGTMVSVAVYFSKDLKGLCTSPWRKDQGAPIERRMLALLLIGSIPTAAIGLLFKDLFEQLFEQPAIVCLMLLVTGALLVVAERYRSNDRKQEQMNIIDALVVGTVQGFAIVPGISRSGSTIAALLFRGIDGETAARFSFLLAMPAVFGAALISLKDLEQINTQQLSIYLAGTGAALVVGFFCIHLIMGVVRRRRLSLFAIYCWLAGSLGFVYFL